MNNDSIPKEYERLHQIYINPDSEVFLEKNNVKLLKFIKQNPRLQYLKTSDIIAYKNKLSQISKDRQRRILRGRKDISAPESGSLTLYLIFVSGTK